METRLIQDVMTRSPACIQRTAPIAEAYELMRSLLVRHLLVLDGKKLTGVVSQRDLYRLETIDAVDRSRDVVGDSIGQQELYVVPPDAPIDEVAEHMAKEHLGSAVVMGGQGVAGIFTSTDALLALAKLVKDRPRHSSLADKVAWLRIELRELEEVLPPIG
jgi:acetoin utilization protein AcuB